MKLPKLKEQPLFDVIDRMERELVAAAVHRHTPTPLSLRAGKPSGDQLKAEGMDRVISATPEDYRRSFEVALMSFLPGMTLTVEDVANACGRPPEGRCNVVGALMSGLAKKGIIKKTPQRRKATRSSRRSGELTVWVRVEVL